MPSLSFGRDMPQPSVDDEAFARRGRDQDGSPALVRLGQSAIGATPTRRGSLKMGQDLP
jgi:hypothetical protein